MSLFLPFFWQPSRRACTSARPENSVIPNASLIIFASLRTIVLGFELIIIKISLDYHYKINSGQNPVGWDGQCKKSLYSKKKFEPCKKYDRDSHGNSMSFSVNNQPQFSRLWHQIPWLFHVIYPHFIWIPWTNMTYILDKFRSWNFHGIC